MKRERERELLIFKENKFICSVLRSCQRMKSTSRRAALAVFQSLGGVFNGYRLAELSYPACSRWIGFYGGDC